MYERRKNKRVHLFAPTTFKLVNGEKTSYGVVLDVSFNGVFIMTNMTVEIFDNIVMDFKINNLPIKLTGKVMRKKVINNPALLKYGKGGMGVHIEYMHPAVLDYIYTRLHEEMIAEQKKLIFF